MLIHVHIVIWNDALCEIGIKTTMPDSCAVSAFAYMLVMVDICVFVRVAGAGPSQASKQRTLFFMADFPCAIHTAPITVVVQPGGVASSLLLSFITECSAFD